MSDTLKWVRGLSLSTDSKSWLQVFMGVLSEIGEKDAQKKQMRMGRETLCDVNFFMMVSVFLR